MTTHQSSTASPFPALPFDTTKQHLRLWRFEERYFHQGTPRLVLETWSDPLPSYIALSYAWGDAGETEDLIVNSRVLRITENLYDFLVILNNKPEYRWKYFWADQISINQNDTSERNHQVGLMDRIYSNAVYVYAWLGHVPDIPAFVIDPFDAGFMAEDDFMMKKADNDFALTVLWLATNQYWTRLWIFQELYLARRIRICCRQSCIEVHYLAKQVRALRHNTDADRSWLLRLTGDNGQNRRLNYEIMRRVETFRQEYAPKIQLVVAKGSTGQQRFNSLTSIIMRFCDGRCSDLWDKVFGLQALVQPSQRMNIDYSLPENNLLCELIRLMIIHREASRSQAMRWSLLNDPEYSTYSKISRFNKVAASLQVPVQQAKAICWAYMAARILDDLRVLDVREGIRWNTACRTLEAAEEAAVTKKQQEFASDVLTCSHDFVGPSLSELLHLEKEFESLRRTRVVQISRVILDVVQGAFHTAMAKHGLMMFGEFLSHPDDWHCSNKQTSEFPIFIDFT